jgi:inorganic pyrophosphatase
VENGMPRVDLCPYLGRTVTVTIDRPLGSRHPRYADLRYPINYGFVAGTTAGDGEPIDAYILGVGEPIATMEGIVIALVLRNNDTEDKLVVAPAGRRFSHTEIRQLVDFQERFFDSRIVAADAPPIADQGPSQRTPAR